MMSRYLEQSKQNAYQLVRAIASGTGLLQDHHKTPALLYVFTFNRAHLARGMPVYKSHLHALSLPVTTDAGRTVLPTIHAKEFRFGTET